MKRTLSKNEILKDRAEMFAKARAFFAEKGVMEVDCPLLSASASIDAHIDLIPVRYHQKETRYLHSSPEFGMKRLLAQQIGDIYQLSHVFRDGEQGKRHNPEFTMAEWYRIGMSFEDLIEETCHFVRLFLGPLPFFTLTYREAFKRYVTIDYVDLSVENLREFIKNQEIFSSVDSDKIENKDDCLNLILGTLIEHHLGHEGLCVLTHYPASQAALAKTIYHDNEEVAERFEVYYQGVELANGYHELADAGEQRKRFEEANHTRKHLGKSLLPLDENFLNALQTGLPECCGVAVGFDRLMMLRHGVRDIASILPFSWQDA